MYPKRHLAIILGALLFAICLFSFHSSNAQIQINYTAIIEHKPLFKEKLQVYENKVILREDTTDAIIGYEVLIIPIRRYTGTRWWYKTGILYQLNATDSIYDTTTVTKNWGLTTQGFKQLYFSTFLEWLKDDDFKDYRSNYDHMTMNQQLIHLWNTPTSEDKQFNTYFKSNPYSGELESKKFVNIAYGDTERLEIKYTYHVSDSVDHILDELKNELSLYSLDVDDPYLDEENETAVRLDSTLSSAITAYFNYSEQSYVVVDFWRYSCKYCHPMNNLLKDIIRNDSVDVISVYCEEEISKVVRERLNTNYDEYYDMIYITKHQSRLIGVSGMPRVIVVNRDLEIVEDIVGFRKDTRVRILQSMN